VAVSALVVHGLIVSNRHLAPYQSRVLIIREPLTNYLILLLRRAALLIYALIPFVLFVHRRAEGGPDGLLQLHLREFFDPERRQALFRLRSPFEFAFIVK